MGSIANLKSISMFREESVWIKHALAKIQPLIRTNEVANIGSSTSHFREVIQPHIHQNIISPLNHSGWKVTNIDLKQEPGVDMVADVTSQSFSEGFENKFGLTICTNLLEHVEDIDLVVKNLANITRENGYILITVPHKYKLHYDPIDNGFRPTPFEIASRFISVGTAVKVIDECIISIQEIEYYRVKKSKVPIWGHRERIQYYLGKRHKVSGILLQIDKTSKEIVYQQQVSYRGTRRPMKQRAANEFFFF